MAEGLITLDPGTSSAGLACFFDTKLQAVFRAKRPSEARSGPGEGKRWALTLGRDLVDQAQKWLVKYPHIDKWTVVSEYQQIYQSGTARTSNAKDVLVCTLQTGYFLGGVRETCCDYDVTCIAREPAKWKGQMKKDKMNQLTLHRLSPDEIDVLDTLKRAKRNPDVLDAVGIGLDHLRRLR